MSPSSFAGNPFFLDLETLAQDGLLTAQELSESQYPNPDRVDYPWLHMNRPALLRKAWERGRTRYAQELDRFLEEEADWLPDFAFFLALRDHFGGAELKDWPREVRTRQPEALAPLREALAEEIYHAFLQFLFFRQWDALKRYANERGISIIGDLPIYVSPDSAEVWANPSLFQLDEDFHPTAVAGVPPDAFSDEGQHWGNPLYDWDYHRSTGYAWWRRRGEQMARLYDVVRIDHFRAFHTYWSIPLDAPTAKAGHWEPGPGLELVELLSVIPGLHLIAEDLGDLDDEVRAFIAQSGLPGMKTRSTPLIRWGRAPICPTTARPIPSSTPAPTTPPPLSSGSLRSPAPPSGSMPPTTSASGGTRASAGGPCAGPGPPLPAWPWSPCRTCWAWVPTPG